MTIKATVLCENSIFGHVGAIAEHGWAVWLETPGGNFLFDTGQGKGLLNNAAFFGKDLTTTQAILISHHHRDHTGGLLDALQTICNSAARTSVDIVAHPDLFKDGYAVKEGEKTRHIGIPFSRSVLEAAGANFRLQPEWLVIQEGMYMSGEVPRQIDFEIGDLHIKHYDEQRRLVFDPVRDDQTLVFETDSGLFVILGCSHAGLINILNYISQQTGRSDFHTIIGGTHLEPVSETQVAETIKALERFDIGRIGVSHCTGPQVAARLAAIFGERFFFCGVGAEVVVA